MNLLQQSKKILEQNDINQLALIKSVDYDIKKDDLVITCSLTTCCNYRCSYCADVRNKIKYGNIFININNVLNFLNIINKIFSNKKIKIECTGGEPTLHPKLYEFCEKLNKLDYISNIKIYSNFSQDVYYYDRFLNSFDKLDFIFSWHSENKFFYKKLLNINYKYNNRIYIYIMFEKPISESINIFKKIKLLNRYKIQIDLIYSNKFCETDMNYYSKKELSTFFNIHQFFLKNDHMYEQYLKLIFKNGNTAKINYINQLYLQSQGYFNNYKLLCRINPLLEKNIYINSNGNIFNCYNSTNSIHILDDYTIIVKYFYRNQCIECKNCTAMNMQLVNLEIL